MAGPFEEAAQRLNAAAEEADKAVTLLTQAQEAVLRTRQQLEAVYAGTNAGHEIQSLGGNLTQGATALTMGAGQFAQAIREAAARAAQGRS